MRTITITSVDTEAMVITGTVTGPLGAVFTDPQHTSEVPGVSDVTRALEFTYQHDWAEYPAHETAYFDGDDPVEDDDPVYGSVLDGAVMVCCEQLVADLDSRRASRLQKAADALVGSVYAG